VDAVRRRSADGSWLFLLNHTSEDQPVAASGHDLVRERAVGPEIVVPARGVAVVREEAAAGSGHEEGSG
jgi:beta-galactosidase